jgi:formamidopyrimidine-DNA glycosylase
MPELPEVETVVRGLRAVLPGRTIVGVRLGKTDFIDDPALLAESVPGKRVISIARYGKFIDIALDPAAPSPESDHLHLIVHLGMTGRLVVREAAEPAPKHTHTFFELDDGRELRYVDSRRFGRMLVLQSAAAAVEFHGVLGAEPLEISAAEFRARLSTRRARIKALLLDQHVLCGIGNIYADESLWKARIHPAQIAARLSAERLDELRNAMRGVLRHAIKMRGSSISDFVDADGNPGSYQQRHCAYGREGEACPRCRTAIRRAMVAGRSSYFCPRCQPVPRPVRPAKRDAARKRGRAKPSRAKRGRK